MFDKLKDHVNQNREEFELYPFNSEKGWDRISGNLPVEKQHNYFFLKVAASIVIVLSTIFIFTFSDQEGQLISSEIQETQRYYEGMIDTQMMLVKTQVDDPKILADLEALDNAFNELSSDLEEDVQNEEVISAMIDNYRLKLKILEKILEDLEQDRHEDIRGI